MLARICEHPLAGSIVSGDNGNANGADEQAHRPFLPGEDVFDRRSEGRFASIGLGGAARHRFAFRLFAMDLRAQQPAGEEILIGPGAIGGIGPDITGGVVGAAVLRHGGLRL